MSMFDACVCQWLNTATISMAKKQTVLNRMAVGISNYRTLELDIQRTPPPTQQSPLSASYSGIGATPKKGAAGTPKGGRGKGPQQESSRARESVPMSGRPTNANTSVAILAQQPIDIDYSLQQKISKALRRLQEGDSGTESCPLFSMGKLLVQSPQGSETNAVVEPDGFIPCFSRVSNQPTSPATTSVREQKGAVVVSPPCPAVEPAATPPAGPGKDGVLQSSFCFGETAPADFTPREDEENRRPDQTMTEREDMQRRCNRRKSRNAVSGETIDPEAAMSFQAAKVEKPADVTAAALGALETHHLFSPLDDSDLAYLVGIMRMHTYAARDPILRKNEPNDKLFVVVKGAARVVSSPGGAEPAGALLGVGETVGDIGLMYDSQNPATVEAADDGTVCCSIGRLEYKSICTRASQGKRERYEGFLGQVRFLKGLTRDELFRLADALKAAKYSRGDKIIRYGEQGVWFSIIVEGEVDVIGRDAAGAECHVCTFRAGDCVGELEFLFGHKTVADCVAATDIVRTAKMTTKHFENVIGPAKEVLERQAQDAEVYTYYRKHRSSK